MTEKTENEIESDEEVIRRIQLHCNKHEKSGRATFSVDGVRRLIYIIHQLQRDQKLRH